MINLLLTVPFPAGRATAPPLSVDRLVWGTDAATQAVVVTAPVAGSSFGTLETFRKAGGAWVRAFPANPARLGRTGFGPSKREGDGHTPVGEFGIGGFMFGGRPNPGVRYPYRRLQVGDWWDEHVGSPTYNSFQHATGVPPFAAGSEPLWRILPAYDYAAVIAYNMSPVVQGAGSGIFLHVGTGGPTAGCVSLARGDLLTVLRWLDPAARPVIAMGPSPWILRG